MEGNINESNSSDSDAFADLVSEGLLSGLNSFQLAKSCDADLAESESALAALSSGIAGQSVPGVILSESASKIDSGTSQKSIFDMGALDYTDKSGIEVRLSANDGQTKRYPTFGISQLPELYLKNEKRVDANHDGYLERSEIAKAFLSHDFKGEDAQFLAALQLEYEYIRKQRTAIFGIDRAGIGFDDVKELADKTVKKSVQRSRVLDYEPMVRQMFSSDKVAITEVDVRNLITSDNLDRQTRERLTHFIEDFDKYKQFDLNPFATATITLESFDQGVREQTTGSDFIAFSAMEGFIYSGTKAVEASPDRLWQEENNPLASIRPEVVLQGSIGNCAFLAGLSSLAAVAPGKITQMIKTNSDGSYTVSFPGATGVPIVVAKPTESEAMLYAARTESGYWVQVLEKAYGQYLIGKGRVSPNARDIGSSIPSEGGDGGAALEDALSLLSDRPIKKLNFKTENDDAFREAIGNSLKDGRPMTLALYKSDEELKSQKSKFGGLLNNHAYSIIGFDTKSGIIKIRNPNGRGEPPAGLLSRDCKDDGIFEMPLAKLREYFSEMAFSTG